MSEQYRELMQEAVRELRKAKERIATLERAERNRHGKAAIVGLGCHLPCGIEDPEALWQFFVEGRCASTPPPEGRFAPLGIKDVIPNGAWLDNPFGFDASFFRVAPREAKLVDPQQRLLLEVAHNTIEHAGIAPDSLRDQKVGVFVGISTQDYFAHLTQHLPNQQIDGAAGPGTNNCGAAGRVSFALGLVGPSLSVNTACSSSLVALHLAMQALRNGECEMALVLGVNAMLSPLTSATFQRAGMLAKDGRCKTFAADADGYARGEGALGILLANESAVTDRKLRRHADVLGSAINQDGATAGLTVPSGAAQERVVRAALADAGLAPADVHCIEAHGTGTLLGDPIELQALHNVFAGDRKPEQPLHVASAKTNFGHLEAAAGLLSLIKATLQIEHQTLAPHLNCREPNPHGPWADAVLRVPLSCRDYPDGERQVAGISSFSFTGTNAHVVISSGDDATTSTASEGTYTLPISGKSDAALRAQCRRWATFLASHRDLPFADVAATAALGRTHYKERAAITASDGSTAAQLLLQLADGAISKDDAATSELARTFVAGTDVAWHEHVATDFRRLALPTYAFQRQDFRVPIREVSLPTIDQEQGAPSDPAATREAIAALAPEQRPAALTQVVQQACAAILQLQPGELSCDEPLLAYGFDSMRAVELATRLEQELGQAMPFSDLIDGATIRNVATAIDRRFNGTTTAESDAELLRRIQSLSDEEARQQLREQDGER